MMTEWLCPAGHWRTERPDGELTYHFPYVIMEVKLQVLPDLRLLFLLRPPFITTKYFVVYQSTNIFMVEQISDQVLPREYPNVKIKN